MDDTFVIQQQAHKQGFLEHINSMDPAIKFTVEGNQGNGAIPFLETLVTPKTDNSLSIAVYCKPTYTDQHLQWDSHHNLSTKYSVIGTLTNRAETVCTRPEHFQKELQHLGRLWSDANIPTGPLAGSKINISATTGRETSTKTTYKTIFPTPMQAWTKHSKVGTTPTPYKTTTIQMQAQKKSPYKEKPSIGYVVIPYTKGITDSSKNICGKYGIQAYFKGNTTIKQMLMKPKD